MTEDEIRALLEAATPGRWRIFRNRDGTTNVISPPDADGDTRKIALVNGRDEANASLIAAAPSLAAEVLRLREALRPFADIGISENPDYQPLIRMDRDAILRARAALKGAAE